MLSMRCLLSQTAIESPVGSGEAMSNSMVDTEHIQTSIPGITLVFYPGINMEHQHKLGYMRLLIRSSISVYLSHIKHISLTNMYSCIRWYQRLFYYKNWLEEHRTLGMRQLCYIIQRKIVPFFLENMPPIIKFT